MSVLQPPFPTQTIRGGRDNPAESVYADYLAASASTTLIDLTETAVVIDHLLIGARDSAIEVDIAHRSNVPGPLISRHFGDSLGSVSWVTLDLIRQSHSAEFCVQKWLPDAGDDVTTGKYIIRLRNPIYWPFGGWIRIRNEGALAVWVNAKVAYRVL